MDPFLPHHDDDNQNQHHHHQTRPQFMLPGTTQSADGGRTYSFTYPHPHMAYYNHHHDQETKGSYDSVPIGISLDSASVSDNGEDFFNSLPTGFRFCPTKEELVKWYLLPKIAGNVLPPNPIRDVNIYGHHPNEITERNKVGEEESYFFTPRDRKYKNGSRPARHAGEGFWKATGGDDAIKDKGKTIGVKRSLVYFEGKPKNAKKTNWLMHEYCTTKSKEKTTDKSSKDQSSINMRLDDVVLCRIYRKVAKINVNAKGPVQKVEEVQHSCNHTNCVNPNPTTNGSGIGPNGFMMNSSHDPMDIASTSRFPPVPNFPGDFPIPAGPPPPPPMPLNYGYVAAADDHYHGDMSMLSLDDQVYNYLCQQLNEASTSPNLDQILPPIYRHHPSS